MPPGVHRIRDYILFANSGRTENLARARELLGMPAHQTKADEADPADPDEPPSLARPNAGVIPAVIMIDS